MTNSIGKTNQPELIRFSSFAQYKEITHFVTTRHGGVSYGNYDSFNLSCYSGDDPASVTRNRDILCDTLLLSSPDQLIIPYQTHSDQIRVIDTDFIQQDFRQQAENLTGVDALVTNLNDICIGVTTADCVPILLYDPIKKVTAAIHAGWRGTVARIAGKTVGVMVDRYGCNPADLVAAIGPSIGPDAFEVGNEVAAEFCHQGFNESIIPASTKPHINLWHANSQALIESGVLFHHIEVAGICTYTSYKQFFSARRLGIHSGRLVTGIIIRN